MIDQKILGRTFLDIAEAIKDKIAMNIVEGNSSEDMNLTREQMEKVISLSKAAVDQLIDSSLDTIIRLTTPPKKTSRARKRKR